MDHYLDYFDFDPVEYIGALLGATTDGKLTLTYYDSDGKDSIQMRYSVDWDFDDACVVGKALDYLLCQLHSISQLHEMLKDREHNAKFLSPEQLNTWEIFLAPFEAWEIDTDEIANLQIKEKFVGLTEEETALLEASREWYEWQCLQRLPCNACAPTGVIHEARRYYKSLVGESDEELESIVFLLAEQMVLYYCLSEQKAENKAENS